MPTVSWTPDEPLDLQLCMARYSRWGDDPVNRIDSDGYWRVLRTGGGTTAYSAAQPDTDIVLTTDGNPDLALEDLQTRLATHLPMRAVVDLAAADPVIATALDDRPGYRPPLEPDLLASLITSISAQQVNLQWATTTRQRLVERYGTTHRFGGRELWAFPTAETLANADPRDLRELQFTTRKSEYIVGVAQAVATGDLRDLAHDDDATVIARLTAIRGVGRWTADWALARHLGRPHVIAAGDLGVRKAISHIYLGHDELLSEELVRKIATPWGDATNWATHLLLESLSAG